MTSEVRRLGALTEVVHAVVYFAPQVSWAYRDAGLKGFWRGYFAGRSAALGAASPQLVTAVFAGFSPDMVARSLPEVWSAISPEQALQARTDGAHAALREHRGDGHVAAVMASGLRWPEPHLLLAGHDRLDPRQQEHRGWSDEQWDGARRRLQDRDLLDEHGSATPAGEQAYAAIEQLTDELAAPAYAVVDRAALLQALEPIARRVVDGEVVPFPNAMGLPRVV